MLIISRSYLVEVNLANAVSTGARYNFLDVPQLRKVYVQGVEAFDITGLAVSPNGKTIVSAAGSLSVIVTLCVGDKEDIYQIPYYTLVAKNNGGIIREFANKMINLTKSYVQLVGTAGLTANESCIFNFYYK